MYRLKYFWVVLICIVIIGCGSGSSNPSESDSSLMPLQLAWINAKDVAERGIKATEFLAANIFINLELLNENAFVSGISSGPCVDGGGKIFDFQDNDLSTQFSDGDVIIITDSACQLADTSRNGEIRISFGAGTSAVAQRYVGMFEFSQHILSSSVSDTEIDGQAEFDITFGVGLSSSMVLVTLSEGLNIKIFSAGSPTAEILETVVIHAASRIISSLNVVTTSVDIKMKSSLLQGVFAFKTTSDIVTNGGEYPISGSLLFTGVNNSAIKILTSEPPSTFSTFSLDEDGDGIFELNVMPAPEWKDLTSGFLLYLP